MELRPDTPLERRSIGELQTRTEQVLDEVHREGRRLVVQADGAPAAALIPVADLQLLLQLEADRARRFATLDRVGDAFKDVPADELEREVAKAIAEVRLANRKRYAAS
ncbi:MAG TPA: hypothetical protein VFA70_10120 [Dehalococcoidia bacterium]|jgi:prevent-host-death family protein|nr:hypothetical protein [Dehalococcoidia bacterium]